MNLHTRRAIRISSVMAVGLAGSAWAQTTAPADAPALEPAPAAAASGQGVIKGDNVYVRSGPNTNYYPVTKLHHGHGVTVVGEESGWLEILPPEGAHSLIDKNYVDRVGTGDQTGVVNGTTWVHTGSDIDSRKYARQVKLGKGERVHIIGETDDGAYYKINAPKGATVWVKSDLVDRTGGTARAESPRPPDIEPLTERDVADITGRTTEATPGVTLRPTARATATRPASAMDDVANASEKYQAEINAIEAEVAAESAKPARDRVFEPVIRRLRALADQEEDLIAQKYAQVRVQQLRDHIALVSAVQEMRSLRENALGDADEIRRQRELLMATVSTPLDDIVVRGQIRVSGIYDGTGSRPKRWRIVEAGGDNRTLAYIEVPQGSPIDPVQFYGRYVGIRASARHTLRTTIPPLSCFTVEEIIVLDPEEQSRRSTGPGTGVAASPAPREVAAPSSQPAE